MHRPHGRERKSKEVCTFPNTKYTKRISRAHLDCIIFIYHFWCGVKCSPVDIPSWACRLKRSSLPYLFWSLIIPFVVYFANWWPRQLLSMGKVDRFSWPEIPLPLRLLITWRLQLLKGLSPWDSFSITSPIIADWSPNENFLFCLRYFRDILSYLSFRESRRDPLTRLIILYLYKSWSLYHYEVRFIYCTLIAVLVHCLAF